MCLERMLAALENLQDLKSAEAIGLWPLPLLQTLKKMLAFGFERLCPLEIDFGAGSDARDRLAIDPFDTLIVKQKLVVRCNVVEADHLF